ncbi:MAG: tetratricopeptide repeat protein [Xanthobacteraceae bacterium]|jgi:tetratricopeptide (TPR) repeat protein
MLKDAHGLTITTSSAEAAAAYDRTIESYLKARLDARDHLAALLKADPQFGLAQCLKGYFAMLLYKQAALPAASEAARKARLLTQSATARERLHVDALEAWVAGDLDRLLAIWEAILREYPTDVLAFRLAHYKYFWTGRAREMLASLDRIAPRWGRELPGYGPLLGCRSFALEECGDYAAAEAAGRESIEIDPADLWAAHAVAHVMEMQGRPRDGIAWLEALAPHWEGTNQLQHHLWWHRALYHYEQREFDKVLALYDESFRNLNSPLTQSQPDFIIDVQNAASMLFRLERQGVDVGNRWIEIAEKAEQRIDDCLSPFTLPHWMMALAATGRDTVARRMLDAMRAYAKGVSDNASVVREIALPVSEAVVAHRHGEYSAALDVMRPIIADTQRMGGSHAQHDVLRQLFLDCAVRAGSADDIRRVLALAGRYPAGPDHRVGYAKAAQTFRH